MKKAEELLSGAVLCPSAWQKKSHVLKKLWFALEICNEITTSSIKAQRIKFTTAEKTAVASFSHLRRPLTAQRDCEGHDNSKKPPACGHIFPCKFVLVCASVHGGFRVCKWMFVRVSMHAWALARAYVCGLVWRWIGERPRICTGAFAHSCAAPAHACTCWDARPSRVNDPLREAQQKNFSNPLN